jgi:hypothetical protein
MEVFDASVADRGAVQHVVHDLDARSVLSHTGVGVGHSIAD